MKNCSLLLLFFVLRVSCMFSQNHPAEPAAYSRPFILGHIDTLYSEELGENRILNIYLPTGYSPDSAATYPVIYLLDGAADEDFIHIAGLVQFCSFPWVERLPPSILVGIANVERRRDFTFPTAKGYQLPDFAATFKEAFRNAGGSSKFMAFIEKELQPFVANTYKTNGSNMLIGQSLAGLFAAEILLKKPKLFKDYVIMSPSLWWNNTSLLTQMPVAPSPNTRVYIAVGKEGKMMVGDAKKLARLIKKKHVPEQVFFEYLPDEDHGTILHPAVGNAFKLWFEKKRRLQ
ncbi:MAG TPA: alpha/beta hydrolase-fold protein [Haliscomenobacter sp.]|uniref:alpha/beta hydrolase n=1 Tax=Haliscomenobacter sp. TaxID=2717303 RepID=UPI002C101FAB|nr:alpha/beta hydrolase-fold protein [Haliscomenobacter sp.]HOY21456.1 alpha/beta hydrolase-fold protein [Haliscomenobacter sp.]